MNRQVQYREYIFSEAWAKKRAMFWSRHPRRCARCGSTVKLHVHHMTYERFKKERMSDLIGLCQRCHRLVHRVHRRDGGDLQDVTLAVVSKPPRRKLSRRRNADE